MDFFSLSAKTKHSQTCPNSLLFWTALSMKMECAEQEIYIRLDDDWNTLLRRPRQNLRLTQSRPFPRRNGLNVVEFSAFLAFFPKNLSPASKTHDTMLQPPINPKINGISKLTWVYKVVFECRV